MVCDRALLQTAQIDLYISSMLHLGTKDVSKSLSFVTSGFADYPTFEQIQFRTRLEVALENEKH